MIFIRIFFLFSLCSCGEFSKVNTIDLDKSEGLIPLLDQINFYKIDLEGEILIINDTLIKFDKKIYNETVRWITDSITAFQWSQIHNVPIEILLQLRNRMAESNNRRIFKEKGAYFFSEGGWIDSNYGKAYSKINISQHEKKFIFDRVQTIEPINNRPNWYNYYAD